MTDAKAAKPQPPGPSCLAGILDAAALMLAFISLLGFLGAWNCFVDLLAHFRVQYAVALATLITLALVVRAPRAVGIGTFALVLNAAVIVPLFIPLGGVIDDSVPPLKIASFNVLVVNRQFDEVANFLLGENADLILLTEVDDEWLSAMSMKLNGYRLVEGSGRERTFGIALFAREAAEGLVVDKAERRDITGGVAEVLAIIADLHWHDQPLVLLGMHTCTPLTEQTAARRDAELAAAARWSTEQQVHGKAVLALGDFNATPWSHAFRRLETEGKLLNSQRGFGVQASFKSNWPALFGIPIDHCVHSSELRVVKRVVEPNGFGSDHRPLIVTVGWVE